MRKWKKKGTLGGESKWEFEVGGQSGVRSAVDAEGLVESSSNVCYNMFYVISSKLLVKHFTTTSVNNAVSFVSHA